VLWSRCFVRSVSVLLDVAVAAVLTPVFVLLRTCVRVLLGSSFAEWGFLVGQGCDKALVGVPCLGRGALLKLLILGANQARTVESRACSVSGMSGLRVLCAFHSCHFSTRRFLLENATEHALPLPLYSAFNICSVVIPCPSLMDMFLFWMDVGAS
jgi:hypothetical protein